MTRSMLSSEFGMHRVTPEEIFPALEWESRGPLGQELVQIFKDLTIPETWVAIHDKGNFAACHDSIRGEWEEDPACKIVLVAGTNDNLMLISGFCWLGFFTREEWISQMEEVRTDMEEGRKRDPEAVAEGRIPKRDPVIGAEPITGLVRKGSNRGFHIKWGNEQFRPLLIQIRDRVIAAGYQEV